MEPFTTNLVGVERQSKSDRISAVANLAPDLWSAMGTISRNQIKSNERIEPDYIEVSQLFPPPRPSLDKLTNDIRNGITKHDLSYAISEVLNFPMNFQGKQDPAEMRVISQKLQLEKTLPTGIEVVGASKDGKLLLSDKKHHMYDMDDKGNITDTRGEEYKLVKDKE